MPLKIASFDPASYKNLGWSYIEFDLKKGVIKKLIADTIVNKADSYGPEALWQFNIEINDILEKYKPDLVILEKTSSFSGGFVTGQVSGCIGVIMSCCGCHQIDVAHVFPTHVKKVVTGSGKATKGVIKKSVHALSDYLENPIDKRLSSDHAYDSISNILCWLMDEKKITIKDVKTVRSEYINKK